MNRIGSRPDDRTRGGAFGCSRGPRIEPMWIEPSRDNLTAAPRHRDVFGKQRQQERQHGIRDAADEVNSSTHEVFSALRSSVTVRASTGLTRSIRSIVRSKDGVSCM